MIDSSPKNTQNALLLTRSFTLTKLICHLLPDLLEQSSPVRAMVFVMTLKLPVGAVGDHPRAYWAQHAGVQRLEVRSVEFQAAHCLGLFVEAVNFDQ